MSTLFDGLTENLTWFYGGDSGEANPFTLSAPAECFQYSEPVTRVYPGEFFVFHFEVLQVHLAERYTSVIEILTRYAGVNSGWILRFAPGRDRIVGGKIKLSDEYTDHTFDVPSYKPGELNFVRLGFSQSGDSIFLELNRHVLEQTVVPSTADSRQLFTRVVGLNARFFG